MIFPLSILVGKTAYEVSKEGYSKHLSQQWTWFTDWINGKNNNYTKATDIKTYSPLKYGLFYSNVGEDIQKNDMLENITYYRVQIENEKKQIIEEEKRQKKLEEEEERKSESINRQEITNKIYLKLFLCGILAILIMVFVIVKIITNNQNKKE